MMRYPEIEVRRLLERQFSELESLWEASPYDEALAYAITIKEYMSAQGIDQPAQGIERFWQFKQSQAASLAALGLAPRLTALPSPRLASQSV
jgi:hypothetical protein